MTPDMQNGYIHEFESILDPDDVVRKPIDITEAREMHAKTTQGEWHQCANPYVLASVSNGAVISAASSASKNETAKNDLAFCSFAHNHWSSMLDTIARQAKEIERLKELAAQSVNEVLIASLRQISSLRWGHDGDCGAVAIADNAIAAAEAEIAERRKPVTREWLQSIGSKRVPDDVYPQSEVNDNEQIGRMILWETEDAGVWRMRDADWFDIKTRGDVLDVMGVLGGAQ